MASLRNDGLYNTIHMAIRLVFCSTYTLCNESLFVYPFTLLL